MLRRNRKTLVAVSIVAVIPAGAAIVEGDIPGFRIAITVIAATAGVPYQVFAPSVAVSTAIWAAVGLWLGATVREAIGNVLFDRGWIYIGGLGLLALVLAVALVRAWRSWGARRALTG